MNSLGNIDKGTSGPYCGVKSCKFIISDRDNCAEVLLKELWVLLEPAIGIKEDNALFLKVLANGVINHLRFVLRSYA